MRSILKNLTRDVDIIGDQLIHNLTPDINKISDHGVNNLTREVDIKEPDPLGRHY